MDTTRLRLAEVDDARPLAALDVAAWRTAHRGLMPDALLEALSEDAHAARWRERLATLAPDARTWLLEGPVGGPVGGPWRLLGFTSTGLCRDDDVDSTRTAEVHALYLDPSHVGRGLGRALMTRALDDLRARGFAEVRLWALEGNLRAERFYACAGLSPGRRVVKHVSGHALPHVRWARGLAS